MADGLGRGDIWNKERGLSASYLKLIRRIKIGLEIPHMDTAALAHSHSDEYTGIYGEIITR